MKNKTIIYPLEILKDDRLTHGEKIIYIAINTFCVNNKFFSNKDISEATNILSIRIISEAIKKLSKLGYITSKLEQNNTRTITLNLNLSAEHKDGAPYSLNLDKKGFIEKTRQELKKLKIEQIEKIIIRPRDLGNKTFRQDTEFIFAPYAETIYIFSLQNNDYVKADISKEIWDILYNHYKNNQNKWFERLKNG